MSTIRKQSVYSVVLIYAGFMVGAVNVLLLFPKYFSADEYGLTRLLLELGLLLSTLCTVGMVPVSIKFFPFYQKYLGHKKNDLFFLTLVVTTIALLVMLFTIPVLKPWIIRKFGDKSPLFVQYFDLIYPLTVCMTLFNLFEAYAWITKKAVLSNFLKEFLFRFMSTLLILGWITGMIKGFDLFATLFSYSYLPPLLVLAFFIFQNRQVSLQTEISPVTRRLGKKMAGFGFAFFASATLNALAKTNDSIILASQSPNGLTDTAIFNIATYLVTLMEVPQRSLTSAATPQIAIAWKDRNMERLRSIYRKTALNLMIIGMGLFSLIWLNIADLAAILGDKYAPITTLILILGAAKIIDLGTGMNSQILMLSKHWKIDLFTNMLFVIVSIVLNYILTKKLGVWGPAWGGLIAIIVFNLIRFSAIWKIYGLQPFTWSHLKVIALAMAGLGIAWLIPDLGDHYVNIAVYSLVFILLYCFSILKFRVSADINDLYQVAIKRFSKFNN